MAAIAATLLLGCAAPPGDASWQPPDWSAAAVGQVDVESFAAIPGDIANSDADQADTAGLIDGRVRNDAAGLQARYVQLPGGVAFNERVSGILGAAIAETGIAGFVPESFGVEAGLADRGCTAGSSTISAAELLTDPALGPTGGVGTAVACEITAAFGPMMGVTFRTVVGDATEVTDDQSITLYADLESGAVVDGGELWTPVAATELWTEVVSVLRREAGGLSLAPLASPSEEQHAIAAAALQSPALTDQGVTFRLPAGLSSPELTRLGIAATDSPVSATVAEIDGWLTPTGEQLLSQLEVPFIGVPAWNGAHPVNCSLAACVAVTYDDGPSGFTAELLDIYLANESATTFFMLGNAVATSPEIVARAASEGHELASHTMTHPDLTTVTPAKARAEVRGAAAAISEITGSPVTMYRPPYGAVDEAVLDAVGMPAILWSIDTLDWQDPGGPALVERAVDGAEPGDIILFHDTHAGSVNAAAEILEGLKNRGFTPVTVTQLFEGSVPAGRVSGR